MLPCATMWISLEGILISETIQTQRDRSWSHLYGHLKTSHLQKQRTEEWSLGAEARGQGELAKEYKLSVWRWVSSRDLMHIMVTMVNNNAFYIWNLLRVDLSVLITHPKSNFEVMDMLIRLIVVTISQCIEYIYPKNHIVCLFMHTISFVNHTSIKLGRKKNSTYTQAHYGENVAHQK